MQSRNIASYKFSKEGEGFSHRIFNDLSPDGSTGEKALENFMSVYEYSRFFRILYNSSYLNNENSNKALEILSRVDFKSGLVAGTPANITVAHKFGERENGDEKQLHDCGIVYHPENPYLICIMTRGKDFDKLSEVIAELSKITYEEVSKN